MTVIIKLIKSMFIELYNKNKKTDYNSRYIEHYLSKNHFVKIWPL